MPYLTGGLSWPSNCRYLLRGLPASALMTLLRQMATDFRRYSHGFPDLCLVTASGELSFVELKARGDAVRRNQLSKMLTIASVGSGGAIGKSRLVGGSGSQLCGG